jgi:hypothetical protein
MPITHLTADVVALTQYIDAAGLLQTLRNAVLVFLLIVFLIGLMLGFFIGRGLRESLVR